MSYDEMIAGLKELKCEEKRADLPRYFEVVFSKATLDAAIGVLEGYFGRPFKKAGEYPFEKARKVAEKHGGIQSQQALYVHESEQADCLAMIWPWSSGQSATIKVIREKKG